MPDPSSTTFFVRDLMTVGVRTCGPGTPLEDLARIFLENEWDEVVVLDGGHAIGVVGQDELIRACTKPDFASLFAMDIMRDEVPTVPADVPIDIAAQLMLDSGVKTLFLTHHAGGIEYPAALISYRHFFRWIVAKDPAELSDLGIHAVRKSPIETFIERRDEARRRSKHG